MVFMTFMKEVLLPTLRVGQVVILDNLPAHKRQEAKEFFDEAGIEVICTPPYSPEWNPIERAWAKIKSFLRSYAARSLDALEKALVLAANLVTVEDTINWFAECGYL